MREEEPVFIRSWGTGRWAYNSKNPVGRALIIGSLLIAAGLMYHFFDGSQWSEGELRRAVHGAARALEDEPQTLSLYSDYEALIREAVDATGEGPEHGLVEVERVTDWSGPGDAAAGDASGTDDFEISSDDVADAYCMRIAPHEPEAAMKSVTVDLTVTVEEGPC